MTPASAPWWFIAIIFALGVALVCAPSRVELLRWRFERSEQGRLARAELVAGDLAAKLTRDPVFLADLALAVAQALDELDIARTAGAPKLPDLDLHIGVAVSRAYRKAMDEQVFGRSSVAQDLNDGSRS